MSHFKYLCIPLILFLLISCDGLIEIKMKMSQLLSSKQATVNSDLYIEISSCGESSDSRVESKYLKESKDNVPTIFKDAKYVDCFEKDFKSYAHFLIPIVLSKELKLTSNDYIHLISGEKQVLSLGIPSVINLKIKKLEEDSWGVSNIELRVELKIENDTNKDLQFTVISAYLNGKPYPFNIFDFKKGSSTTIRLSDVSVDSALENEYSLILYK